MSQTIRALHVDDEPGYAEMVGAFLEKESDRLAVESVTSPTKALAAIDRQDFDCIISDYDMPERDGIELLDAVRESHPDIPYILLTGKGSEEIASDAISAGVTDYVQKQPGPEHHQLLANRVLDAVEHYRSKINYEEIFEKSPDGIVIHDPQDGSFVDMNSRYAEMFGYSKQEFLATGFESIHLGEPPYTIDRAIEYVQQAAEDGPLTFEWPGVTKDGSWFWAEVHLAPVELHGEDRILAVVRDISERKEYEERLEKQNQRLEEFTSFVSHDLRNPLSAAEGRLELAREECGSEQLDGVQRALTRMRRLIDDLLTLARESEPVNEKEEISLADLAEDCWDFVKAADAELVTETDARIVADPTRLQQLLENLFRNGVEHSEGDVTVIIGGNEDGFYVADDGPGIPEDNRGKVFESGFSSKSDGTGMGLSIVQKIVDAHDWTLTLTESEIGGARFEFSSVEKTTERNI